MRIYDNRIRDGLKRLRSYAPSYYKDVAEATAIWTGDGYNLDRIMTALERAVNGNLVHSANEQEIRKYEEFLKIPYDSSLSLEERRAAICIHFVGNRHIGAQEIKAIVTRFASCDVEVTFNGRCYLDGRYFLNGEKMLTEGIIGVIITQNLGEPVPFPLICKALEERIPAHLMLEMTGDFLPIIAKSAEKALFFKFGVEADVSSCNYIGRWYLNGVGTLNGEKTFEEKRTTKFEKFCAIMTVAEQMRADAILIKTRKWKLNGEVILNGSRKLAGTFREEF